MKTFIILLVSFLINNIYSQVREIESISSFKQGDFEVNFSTNLGAGFSKTNSTSTYENFNYYDSTYYKEKYSNEYSSRDFLLSFTASIGYYFTDGLSFEPEFDINLITDNEISVSILANLTYNFSTPKKKVYPYVKIGYGLSNYVTYYNYYGGSTDNSLDTKVFNAALGIKLVYTSGSLMRLELNYKYYSNSSSYSYGDQYSQGSIESETGIDALTIAFGYSILF
jgi:hypothetical protein